MKMEWISVEDRFPEVNDKFGYSDSVLVCYLEKVTVNKIVQTIDIAEYWFEDNKHWWSLSEILINHVTHWMPLPEPPEVE